MNNFRSLQKKNKWYKNFAAFSIVLYVLRPFLTGLKQDLPYKIICERNGT